MLQKCVLLGLGVRFVPPRETDAFVACQKGTTLQSSWNTLVPVLQFII